MARNDEKITSNQLVAIMISLIIGIGILSLPREVTEEAGPDGWALIIIGGIVSTIVAFIITRLGDLFPGQSVVEYSKTLLTTPLGILYSLGFILYFLFFCAFEVRVFAEVLKQFLLDRTPTEVIAATFLLTSAYMVRQGVASMGRMAELLVPAIIIPYFLFLLPAVGQMKYDNLLPVLRTSPLKLLSGAAVVTTSYLGFELALLLQVYMKRPKDAGKAMLIAMPLIMVFYLAVVISTVSVLGIHEVKKIIWPSLAIFRLIKVPGAFLENIHGFIMSIWVVSIFMTLSGFYYGAVLTLSRMLKLKDHSLLVLPLAPVIYFFSLVPDNVAKVYDFLDMFSMYLGIPFGFIFPVGLYVLAKLRGIKPKEGKDVEKPAAKND
ncbi:MAG: hypothetical protein HPY66_0444 [Firmicutes bacterium]|nr:hypothetical protein [Bacillota bacterium]MDI6705140.1 endospore germination permease [Bacillota bacterium]